VFIQPNRTRLALAAGNAVRGVISTSDDPQLAVSRASITTCSMPSTV
jgi:hypothetical protein